MKVEQGTLYFKMRDLRVFLGLDNDHAINKLVTEGYLKPVQLKRNGDRLFHPRDVIPTRVSQGKCGPILPVYSNTYISILSSLRKEGYDVADLFPDERGFIEGSDDLRATYIDKCEKFLNTSSRGGTLSAILNNLVEIEPDILPFDFLLGNKDAPLYQVTKHDVFNVSECFGFADETNTECSLRCSLKDRCFATRFDIMTAVARLLDSEHPVVPHYEEVGIQIRDRVLKSINAELAN